MAQIIKDPAPIRKLLEERGMTEAELSRRTGLHKMQINRGLSGKRGTSLHDLAKIASALGVEWATLLPVFGVADPSAVKTTNTLNNLSASKVRRYRRVRIRDDRSDDFSLLERIDRLERAVFGSGK